MQDLTEAQVKRGIAKLKGYEGDACPECGNLTLLRKRHLPQMRHLRQHHRLQLIAWGDSGFLDFPPTPVRVWLHWKP